MPRNSKSYDLLSDAALNSLTKLGERLREARLRRNWTQAETADKAGLSDSSVKKVESGSAHITIGAYLSMLDVFGLPMGFDGVMVAGEDTLGEALSRHALRQRARSAQSSGEDDWEI